MYFNWPLYDLKIVTVQHSHIAGYTTAASLLEPLAASPGQHPKRQNAQNVCAVYLDAAQLLGAASAALGATSTHVGRSRRLLVGLQRRLSARVHGALLRRDGGLLP